MGLSQFLANRIDTLIISINQCHISCRVPFSTVFGHYAVGVVIASDVVLGKKCYIGQNVTIGKHKGKTPILGDYVIVHANATVLGGVTLGHHSIIGAGAVVLKNVPSYTVVVGNPARVIRKIKPKEYEQYRMMC